MRTICKVGQSILFCALLMASIAACGGAGGGAGSSQTIVVGATLPLTGPLAAVGVILKAAYQAAVDDANAAGGIKVNGTQEKINLVILDNASDSNMASSQATTLYLQNNAVALLGPFTPPLVIPVSDVAEKVKRPLISSVAPVEAWLAARPSGWNYSWGVFFDENQQTNLIFQTANLTTTNKRIALFTDTEQDGITMGKLWLQKAPQFGYTVAYHATFPVGTTNFSSQIAAAKAADAQVLIAQMTPPDAIALWKQMKSLTYTVVTHTHLDPLLSLLIVGPIMFVIAYVVQRVILNPLIKRGQETLLVATFGLLLIAQTVFALVFGNNILALNASYTLTGITIFGDTVRTVYVIALVAAVLMVVGTYLILTRLRFGKAVRAAAEDPVAAASVGIDVPLVYGMTFGLAAVISAVGGTLIGLSYGFGPTTGSGWLLRSFAVIVLGGMGSLWGALLGGILIGVLEEVTASIVGPQYRDLIVFAFLVLVLIIRPEGFFGKKVSVAR